MHAQRPVRLHDKTTSRVTPSEKVTPMALVASDSRTAYVSVWSREPDTDRVRDVVATVTLVELVLVALLAIAVPYGRGAVAAAIIAGCVFARSVAWLRDRKPTQLSVGSLLRYRSDQRMNYTGTSGPLRDRDYQRVVACCSEPRQFRRGSEGRAHAAGLIPTLHHLLFVVLGHLADGGATVVQAADALQMRHDSVVELAQRSEAAELIRDERRGSNQRLNRRHLAPRGKRQLKFRVRLHVRTADTVEQQRRPDR
jgi:hypothetical protein